jgi:sarcosine oxidase subunit alpha
MMHRLDADSQEWLDRSVTLTFTFEGATYRGFRGDTITSALAAAGVPYLARSFKYHRRRHVLSFANHDSNTLFQVDGVPNVRGDVTPLRDGMQITAINTFGGLTRDKARKQPFRVKRLVVEADRQPAAGSTPPGGGASSATRC